LTRTVAIVCSSFLALLSCLRGASADLPALAPALPDAPARSFEFTYQVHFPATPNAGSTTRLWLPLPRDDGFQDVRSLHLDSPAKYAQLYDPEYKNRIAMFKPSAQQAAAGFDVTVRFVAVRSEHRVSLTGAPPQHPSNATPDRLLLRFLAPDKLVPIDGPLAALALAHTSPGMSPLQKSRGLYDYVVSAMHDDASGEGAGRGDALWAASSLRGNSADVHSLLIALLRASSIPARFAVGFPLPPDKSAGDIPSYDSWAEFYIPGVGWVPVDASEASKNPTQQEYFFGATDANRVFFTYGRDLRLSSDQQGAPLNFFIYPYAEVNGQPVLHLASHFSFRDVTVSPPSLGN